MLEVNKETFEAEVLHASGAVAVDWWSPQCEPCKELLPEVEHLADQFGAKIKFCKVNVVENRRLAIGNKVLGLPTFLFFKDGQKVAELAGPEACTPEAIQAELNRLA
ncbi:MAG TPA: thioredoxin domain-containing protein [Symbiobacteriaceae bacterium]|nr:thioredoxin domain-containing protein [Symbiobacteriaceae bacterium]